MASCCHQLHQSGPQERELEVRTLGEADRNLLHHRIDCDLPQELAWLSWELLVEFRGITNPWHACSEKDSSTVPFLIWKLR